MSVWLVLLLPLLAGSAPNGSAGSKASGPNRTTADQKNASAQWSAAAHSEALPLPCVVREALRV